MIDPRKCKHEWTEWVWLLPRVLFPKGTFHRDCPRCGVYQLTPSDAEHAALVQKFSAFPQWQS